MKVKILKCSHSMFWYAELVGQTVQIDRIDGIGRAVIDMPNKKTRLIDDGDFCLSEHKTFDGVDLFDGDHYRQVYKDDEITGKWRFGASVLFYLKRARDPKSSYGFIKIPENVKAFHDDCEAEKWISEENRKKKFYNTSYDGVKLYFGDTYYVPQTTFEGIYHSTPHRFTVDKDDMKFKDLKVDYLRFSDIKKAVEWIAKQNAEIDRKELPTAGSMRGDTITGGNPFANKKRKILVAENAESPLKLRGKIVDVEYFNTQNGDAILKVDNWAGIPTAVCIKRKDFVFADENTEMDEIKGRIFGYDVTFDPYWLKKNNAEVDCKMSEPETKPFDPLIKKWSYVPAADLPDSLKYGARNYIGVVAGGPDRGKRIYRENGDLKVEACKTCKTCKTCKLLIFHTKTLILKVKI